MKPDGNTRIYIVGVGGQGSLIAGRLLGEAAVLAELSVTVSEVHGMSQRGGIVESCVLIGGAKSPLIGLGDADLLLAFEPAEALRALPYCGGKTVAVVNTRPIVPFSVALGQAAYPTLDEVLSRLRGVAKRVIAFDAAALAEQAGSPLAVNAVLLGATAATRALPMTSEIVRRAVTSAADKKIAASNARAFDLGFAAVGQESG
jgi:indolepyruvate ferredoxin oxidoreductase beta subunit